MNEATAHEALRLLKAIEGAVSQSRVDVYSSINCFRMDTDAQPLKFMRPNSGHACAVVVLDAQVVRDLRRFLCR